MHHHRGGGGQRTDLHSDFQRVRISTSTTPTYVMSKITTEIDKKIQQLKERRALLLSREHASQQKKQEREAKEIGLWLIKHHPTLIPKLKEQMLVLEGRDGSSVCVR